jgi:hypothetical protein
MISLDQYFNIYLIINIGYLTDNLCALIQNEIKVIDKIAKQYSQSIHKS